MRRSPPLFCTLHPGRSHLTATTVRKSPKSSADHFLEAVFNEETHGDTSVLARSAGVMP